MADDILALIYDASALLDEERFDDWLALTAPDFTYMISTHSDELKKRMVWMDQDHAGLKHLFTNVNRHERYTGRLRRHVAMTRKAGAEQGAELYTSAVAIYHTELNGVTQLYGTGRYHDRIVRIDGIPRLLRREIDLDTRRLAFGPHLPL
jgi:3-phenylpropionate/cinnamic acid dioxygenase small subunit